MPCNLISRRPVFSLAALAGLIGIATLVTMAPGLAQDPPARHRERPSEGRTTREGGLARGQVEPNTEEGTEEGQPRIRPEAKNSRVAPLVAPPRDGTWKLGVHAYNTDTGVVVTRVQSRGPAWQVGMERGDRIVSVNGFQVGWVQDQLYPLGDELQRQADRSGYVTLLVQNVRNNELLNLQVELDRPRGRRD